MKRLITVLLTLAIIASALSFTLISVHAEQGDSPNLILDNPSFANASIKPFGVSGTAKLTLCTTDSQDNDGYSCRVTSRGQRSWDSTTYNPHDIYVTQSIDSGEMIGTYVFSCWVKVAQSGMTAKLRAAAQVDFEDGASSIGKHGSEVTVTSNEWTKIEVEYTLDFTGKPAISNAKLYFAQSDMNNGENAPDILVDNYSLVKKGTYVVVLPDPEVEGVPAKSAQQTTRSNATQIGAIYYNAYYATSQEWNSGNHTWYDEIQDPAEVLANSDYWTITKSTDQCARALSPWQFHSQAPYFSSCDPVSGKITFPEFTEARWRGEMEYAISGNIDYFAYLISNDTDVLNGIRYHTNNTDINSQIKYTCILQDWYALSQKSKAVLFDAMKNDAWLTVDGMRVLYVYNAVVNADAEVVQRVRKSAVLNGITDPIYIMGMGYTNETAALNSYQQGVNASSFYSVGSYEINESFASLCARNFEQLNNVLSAGNVMPVGAMATLGRFTLPRVINPVSWSKCTSTSLAYAGRYAQIGTNEQIGAHVLDVLNWNKKNADKTEPNLMLMYAWNEFDEGGWLCPTLLCDENGNVQYNADGTAKADTGHLDAVKKAIDIYRAYEEYPSVIVDYEGNITEGNMEHVNLFEEKGDYPEIRIASNGKSIVAGALLESAGRGTYSFYDEDTAGYLYENDIAYNGYLVVQDRDKETAGVSYSLDYSGAALNLNKLAALYGAGNYKMSVKVKLTAGQELSELGKMKVEVSPAKAFSQGYVVFFSENSPVTADGYTSLEIAFNISIDENSQYYRITSADGTTTALLDPASANRVFVMVDQYKDIILGDIKVIEMSHVKQKENLLEQIGDYPEIDIIRGTTSRISGQIMSHAGSNKATLEFIDELHEDYNAAYDVDGNGYLNILNRDRETAGLSYGCNHTGICIDVNKLADNYGSGLYTYSINVKLTPGQEASSAFLQLEASAAKKFVRGNVAINTEEKQVTDSEYTTLSFSFKLVKQNGFYVVSLPDGTNSVVLDNQSFNRIFLRIDEYKDITIDGISIIK